MNPDSVPFNQVIAILKEASNKEANWSKVSFLDKYLYESVISDHMDERTYEKTNRIRNKRLHELARGTKNFDDFSELCSLLKEGIDKNIDGYFNNNKKNKESNEEIRQTAINKIDALLEVLKEEIKKIKKPTLKISNLTAQINDQLGGSVVKGTRMILELYSILDQFDQLGRAVPDFVADYLWEEELEQRIFVRKTCPFILKGDNRTVIFLLLETPLTDEVLLIRLGSDYWEEAEDVTELYEEAFEILRFSTIREALAYIVHIVNEEYDLDNGITDSEDESNSYDNLDSLNKKMTQLLA